MPVNAATILKDELLVRRSGAAQSRQSDRQSILGPPEDTQSTSTYHQADQIDFSNLPSTEELPNFTELEDIGNATGLLADIFVL